MLRALLQPTRAFVDGFAIRSLATKASSSASVAHSVSGIDAAVVKIPKALSAYNLFCTKERHRELSQAHPDKNAGDINKLMAEAWHKLPAEEKAKFEALSAEKKQQNKQARAQLGLRGQVKTNWQVYVEEHYDDVRAEKGYPKSRKLTMEERNAVVKELSEGWKKMSPEQKAEYNADA